MTRWSVGLVALGFLLVTSLTAYGDAIWTTYLDCGGESQDVNHYYFGDLIYINGSGFAEGEYHWDITGQPGGASCDPKIAVASGTVTISQAGGVWSCTVVYETPPPYPGAACLTCGEYDPTCTLTGTFCFPAYRVQPDDCGEYTVDVGKKNDNYQVEGEPLVVTVSGLEDLTVTQPLIGTWSSLPNGFMQSLGSLTVSITAYRTVSYTVSISYSVSPDPAPPFVGDPLLFDDPNNPGTWTTIPSALAPPETLPGLSSGTQSKTYPVVVDLTKLGDRKAGETFTFTVHVNVVVTGSGL